MRVSWNRYHSNLRRERSWLLRGAGRQVQHGGRLVKGQTDQAHHLFSRLVTIAWERNDQDQDDAEVIIFCQIFPFEFRPVHLQWWAMHRHRTKVGHPVFFFTREEGGGILHLVSYPTRWSLLFIFGFLYWSSSEQRNKVQLCTADFPATCSLQLSFSGNSLWNVEQKSDQGSTCPLHNIRFCVSRNLTMWYCVPVIKMSKHFFPPGFLLFQDLA